MCPFCSCQFYSVISSVTWNLSDSHRHNIRHPNWRSLSCAAGKQCDFDSMDANTAVVKKRQWISHKIKNMNLRLENITEAFLVAHMLDSLPAMWETPVWSLGGEDPLEKEMATHCSILVWRIPWREEPDRLQFMGHKESDMTD